MPRPATTLLLITAVVVASAGVSRADRNTVATPCRKGSRPETPAARRRYGPSEAHLGTGRAGLFLAFTGLSAVARAAWSFRPAFRGEAAWLKVALVALVLVGLVVAWAGADLATHGSQGKSFDQWLAR